MKIQIKQILQSNYFYIILTLFIFLFLGLNLFAKKQSVYSTKDKEFVGKLIRITAKENKISFEITDQEKLLCIIYTDNLENKINIKDFPLGSIIKIKGTLKEPLNNTIPNTFNYKNYLYNHGINYICQVDSIELIEKNKNILYKFKNSLINKIHNNEINDYMSTLIIGDKSFMDEKDLNNYRLNGVTHLFAISGMHIGLFALILLKIFKLLKFKEKNRYLITIIFIWIYAFIVGFTPSIQRAGMLFTLLTINKFLKLNISTLKLLIITASILIMINYKIIFDIGFIYSFVTTFGLIYSSKFIDKHKILGTSLIAFLFSLPITICNFYEYNLLSIIINILFVPIVTIIIYPLVLLSLCLKFLIPLTKMAIFFLELLNTFFAKCTFFTFSTAKMSIIIILIYYIILFFIIKKEKLKYIVILILLTFIGNILPHFDKYNHIEFLDVGQGDSTLIRSSYNKEIILVDTGGKINDEDNYHVVDNTITYLKSIGINRIDYLILTHGDADHLGDALFLINNFKVKNIILNRGDINDKEKELLETKVNIKKAYDGILNIESLNNKVWDDENSNSIILSLNLGSSKILLMGDAPKKVEKYIMENNYLRNIDIIKLGHHGSKTSSDYNFLKEIKAELAIISSGRNNLYKHPNKETIETLERLNIDYLNTQTSGSILFKIKNNFVTYDDCKP